jgi:serine/threonine protein kinase
MAIRARVGSYDIDSEYATDATTSLHRATHRLLPRSVIVKLANELPEPSSTFTAVQVLREACILDALQHPGIVRVYESGLTADRRPWFAFEHVKGPTLAQLLALEPTGKRLAIDRSQTIALLRDLAAVLEHAHRRGIVHCGLRPDRIVLARRAESFPLCVVDWSDARAHDAAPLPYAPTLESWHYTAPELARGEAVTDRADVYSLGAIANELLTGAPLARGSSPRIAVALEARCPDAPRELTAMIARMLSPDPLARPSAAEIVADLSWLVDVLAAPPLPLARVRIRRPRWTPAIELVNPEHDALDRVIADLDLEPPG